MASHRNDRGSKTVVKYKILVGCDGMDGRHYASGEIVSLPWPEQVISSALEHGFIAESVSDVVETETVKEVDYGKNTD